MVFLQAYGCQPCDLIGQDFELPVQITASPAQAVPCGVRSLEEELQEAIQKAQVRTCTGRLKYVVLTRRVWQMDPPQSIDDILDEPFVGVSKCLTSASLKPRFWCLIHPCASFPDYTDTSHHEFPAGSVLMVESQAPQPQNKDDTFLPSPLCSSLLLELPPSPAVINPAQVFPVPPPPPICTSPLPSVGMSRKRRAAALFDAAEWLETLTSGLRPLTPPVAPFVEQDFSLDSDLNVSRVLDLLIEKW